MFHVPHSARMRSGPLGSDDDNGNEGAFYLDGAGEPGWDLICIASMGGGWEHVSVRAIGTNRHGRPSRIPTWREMVAVKAIFWDDDDVVVQYHPRRREYVNCHPHVLHLWRPTTVELPTPPPEFVGPLLTPSR